MMKMSEARRFALSLPEASEADHHGVPSFRVATKIFATVPDEGHLHVMVGPEETDMAVRAAPHAFEELWWGKRLAGVRVDLAAADRELLAVLLSEAWRRKAPKRLSSAVKPSPRATIRRSKPYAAATPEDRFEAVRRLFLALPGLEEGPCYGTPGFRVRGKFLARLREDGETLVVKCGHDERDLWMQADPKSFFTTDHYRGYPTVLVRLGSVDPAALREVIEQAWRRAAPKRLVAERDEKREGRKRSR
jgi:hypothetical protein